jgi:DNA-binding Lrp family transcriptional regulator
MMWRTIELTVSIMKELSITPSHWNVKRSYSEVAKKLGVDEETVRSRVQSLRNTGFLLGWRLILSAKLLGRMVTRMSNDDVRSALLTRTEMGWRLGNVQVSKDYQLESRAI